MSPETRTCLICNKKFDPFVHNCSCPHNRLHGGSLPSVDKEPEYSPTTGQQLPGDYRADLLPVLALLKISVLLQKGAKRHKDEDPSNPKWLQTPVREHVNRAMVHLMSHLSGDASEEHLVHAATRMLFAVHCDLAKKSSTSQDR